MIFLKYIVWGHLSQLEQYVGPMLAQCSATVYDAGPTWCQHSAYSGQRWANALHSTHTIYWQRYEHLLTIGNEMNRALGHLYVHMG